MPVQKLLAVGSTGYDVQITPIVQSTGTPDSGKLVALDTDGKLNPSVMPTGIGADVATVKASESLSGGNLVNIYFDEDTWYARKADASDPSKYATGFVKVAFDTDDQAEVYLAGEIAVISELDTLFLTQTPGIGGAYDPTAAIRQLVGRRIGANTFAFIQSELTIL